MGSLLTSSEAAGKILRHFHSGILNEVRSHQSQLTIPTLFDQISIFVQTAVNLRFFEHFDFQAEILPLLNFVRSSYDDRDHKMVFLFLSILKGLAKQGFYYHDEKLIGVW